MKIPRRYFWLLLVLIIGFSISGYFAYRNLYSTPEVFVEEVVVAPNEEKSLRWESNTPPPVPDGFKPPANCETMPQYTEFRGRLGAIVNTRSEFRRDNEKFAMAIDDFRKTFGFPLPIAVKSSKLDELGVVYANCQQTCKGTVNQVFASRVIGNRYLEVLGVDGKLKKVNLVKADLEVAILDEVNFKGIPFRSWPVPFLDGPFQIKDNIIYYGLDVGGLALEIKTSGEWRVVAKPTDATPLEFINPMDVPGCLSVENCFITKGDKPRKFKSPKACGP